MNVILDNVIKNHPLKKLQLIVNDAFQKGNKAPASIVLLGESGEILCYASGHIEYQKQQAGRKKGTARAAAVRACFILMLVKMGGKSGLAYEKTREYMDYSSERDARRAVVKAATTVRYGFHVVALGNEQNEGMTSILFDGDESPIVGEDITTLRGTGWVWQPGMKEALYGEIAYVE